MAPSTTAHRFVLTTALCALAWAPGCSDGSDTQARGPRSAKVETITVSARDLERKLQAVGSLTAGAQVSIRPQVDALLASIDITEGQRVAAGDLIATLDAAKAEARLALATAQRDNARAKRVIALQNFERAKKLSHENLVSTERYQSLEAEFRAAEAALREGEAQLGLAARQLQDYRIVAPFAGLIGQRLVDVGSYVERGQPLTTLLQDDPLEVRFAAPERYTRSLELNTAVVVTDTTGEVTTNGHLSFIDSRVEEQTRMRLLKALIPNKDGAFRPGQFVEVDVLLDDVPQIAVIPEEAVVSFGGDTWVFEVNDGKAERVLVKLGGRSPGEAQVLEGLEPGDVIVVVGQHRLTNGAAVEVVEYSERAERLGEG